MAPNKGKSVASRFRRYMEGMVSVIGHAARDKPLRDYCCGLLLPGERKSVEPIAAMTAPSEVVRRLSASRCFFVTYPQGCKDLNDVLVRHGPGASRRF